MGTRSGAGRAGEGGPASCGEAGGPAHSREASGRRRGEEGGACYGCCGAGFGPVRGCEGVRREPGNYGIASVFPQFLSRHVPQLKVAALSLCAGDEKGRVFLKIA